MTKTSRLRPALWAFVLVLAAPFAPWTDILMMADRNSDGGVDMAEVKSFREPAYAGFQPWMGTNFNALDLNQDGMVTMYEMKKYLMEHKMDDRDLPVVWYRQ
jgi:Ca2+-binding EF-hand superfamily protein